MTMQGIATDADMLDAVERWARVRGFWAHDGNPAQRGWRFSATGGLALVGLQGESVRDPTPYWSVPPAIAVAWAILVESEPPPVDAGPCSASDCRGVGRVKV